MSDQKYVLANIQELIQQIKDAQSNSQKDQQIRLTEQLLKNYPFLFGYFKYLLSQCCGLEQQIELIQQQVQNAPYCRQTWEIYLEFAQNHEDKETFDDEAIQQLYEAALQYIGFDPCSFQIFERYVKQLEQSGSTQQLKETIVNYSKQQIFVFDVSQLFQYQKKYQLFDKLKSYNDQNIIISEYIKQYEEIIVKRNFFHQKQFTELQINALSQLSLFYFSIKQPEQLFRLFYISMINIQIRELIVKQLILLLLYSKSNQEMFEKIKNFLEINYFAIQFGDYQQNEEIQLKEVYKLLINSDIQKSLDYFETQNQLNHNMIKLTNILQFILANNNQANYLDNSKLCEEISNKITQCEKEKNCFSSEIIDALIKLESFITYKKDSMNIKMLKFQLNQYYHYIQAQNCLNYDCLIVSYLDIIIQLFSIPINQLLENQQQVFQNQEQLLSNNILQTILYQLQYIGQQNNNFIQIIKNILKDSFVFDVIVM